VRKEFEIIVVLVVIVVTSGCRGTITGSNASKDGTTIEETDSTVKVSCQGTDNANAKRLSQFLATMPNLGRNVLCTTIDNRKALGKGLCDIAQNFAISDIQLAIKEFVQEQKEWGLYDWPETEKLYFLNRILFAVPSADPHEINNWGPNVKSTGPMSISTNGEVVLHGFIIYPLSFSVDRISEFERMWRTYGRRSCWRSVQDREEFRKDIVTDRRRVDNIKQILNSLPNTSDIEWENPLEGIALILRGVSAYSEQEILEGCRTYLDKLSTISSPRRYEETAKVSLVLKVCGLDDTFTVGNEQDRKHTGRGWDEMFVEDANGQPVVARWVLASILPEDPKTVLCRIATYLQDRP
jgi:hypothetical protein